VDARSTTTARWHRADAVWLVAALTACHGAPREGRGAGQPLYRQACDGGSMRGCYNLALSLHQGTGVPRDPAAAIVLLRRACVSRYAPACFDLGALYDEGSPHVDASPRRAAEFYQLACGSDDIPTIRASCYNLALLYGEGRGVALDANRAARLLARGCDHDDAKSCTALALVYAEGRGATRDPVRAAQLLQRTCDAGWRAACYHLGRFYQDGIGVAADPARAATLIEGACQAGLPAACEARP
jgi:hypothetical protein